ncbi:MAG: hypothetical protein WC205_12620 [Opitutaceae bacterium]|jgi:hypothetical protein
MAELDGIRITTVLTADAGHDVRAGLVALFDGDLHAPAYTGLVDRCEGDTS